MQPALLYASGATQTSVFLTVVIRGSAQPAGWSVQGAGQTLPVAPEAWPQPASALCWCARVELRNLRDGLPYSFQLLDATGAVAVQCSARTLPASLPPTGAPFRMLLASCFSLGNDCGVGDALMRLPAGGQPGLRIFCGDQVYLDDGRARLWADDGDLPGVLFDRYWRTFSQAPRGFGDYLRSGTNFFMSDDHEFWNNAPFPSLVSMNAWTEKGAKRLLPLATQLYQKFQGNYEKMFRFDLDPLSVGFLDLRCQRDEKLENLCSTAERDLLADWIGTLKGPGLLVLGQPLFVEPDTKNDPRRRTGDAAIQHYRQYAELFRVIAGAAHPIVILTGDVHFGRLSWCRPSHGDGPELLEVISSPLAQISFAKGSWCAAPRLVGAGGTRFAGAAPMTPTRWRDAKDHFVTLDFERVGGSVHMGLSRWRVPMDQPVPVDTFPPITL